MLDEFAYTFKIECLPFDDLEDTICDYLYDNGFKGFCWRTHDDYVRVVTIGMTRKKVDEMKTLFKGFHTKQLSDIDILIDCLNPYYRFYGILENDKKGGKRL